jgi:hypothetical protein
MPRFNDYGDALWFDSTLNRLSNLYCETFLHPYPWRNAAALTKPINEGSE